VYNTRTGKKTRIPRLVQMHADKMHDVTESYAGDICAFFGLDCASGDSFVLDKNQTLSMESIFVPDPVISMSIKPKEKKNVDSFAKAVARFTKEDPTYRIRFDNTVKETIASGMGELHLEIYAQRMEREYGCPVEMGKPKVAFRETITSPMKYDYWHRKQTGGRGEYARVIGHVEPLPAATNTTIEFKDVTKGANIPKSLIPAVRKGFVDFCEKGKLAGYPVTGVKMTLADGASHEVDSSDWAFFQAAQFAMEQCYELGQWVVLEPIMLVEVTSPEEFQGAVMSMMTKRGGIVLTTDGMDGWHTLTVEAPLNQVNNECKNVEE
jgi:elongation factor G